VVAEHTRWQSRQALVRETAIHNVTAGHVASCQRGGRTHFCQPGGRCATLLLLWPRTDARCSSALPLAPAAPAPVLLAFASTSRVLRAQQKHSGLRPCPSAEVPCTMEGPTTPQRGNIKRRSSRREPGEGRWRARALKPGQAVRVLLAAALQRSRVHGHDHQPPVQPALHAPHGGQEHRQQHLRAGAGHKIRPTGTSSITRLHRTLCWPLSGPNPDDD
jgi:hypothetical protein